MDFAKKWGASAALVASALLSVAAPALAQDAPDSATLSEEISLPTRTLDNGLEIIVIEDHSLPLVTIEVAVRNGAFTEPPAFNGLSHLYEHMFFKGNQDLPSQEEYMSRVRELGIIFNGTTSDERVNYFFTMGSAQAEEGVAFMSHAIRTPLFKEEELVKEREVVIGELDRNEANPYFHLIQATSEKLWYKYPTRKNTIGDRETITTATVEKMVTVQKKFYLPNNSLLVLAGDITPEQGFALAQEYFGDWERGQDPFKIDPVPPHPPLRKAEAVVVNQPVGPVAVTMNFHGPSVGKDPGATYAADVFSFILAQSNSKFQKALVDTGLVLGAGISYYTLNHTGPITVNFVTTPDKVDQAVEAVKAEVKKFAQADYFTDDQIQTAKTLLAVDHIYGQEKTSAYAHTVSFWWAVAGLDYYTGYIENLNKVTREDMAAYVKKYIHNKPYVLGVLISKENQAAIELSEEKANAWAKPIRP